MDIDYDSLGKRIQKLRKKQNLTQEVLSEKIDITPQYLSYIERNCSTPSLQTIMSLCYVLNTTPNNLLMGIESQPKNYSMPDVVSRLKQCSPKEKRLVLGLIELLVEERDL